jgi:hypothetical protein
LVVVHASSLTAGSRMPESQSVAVSIDGPREDDRARTKFSPPSYPPFSHRHSNPLEYLRKITEGFCCTIGRCRDMRAASCSSRGPGKGKLSDRKASICEEKGEMRCNRMIWSREKERCKGCDVDVRKMLRQDCRLAIRVEQPENR